MRKQTHDKALTCNLEHLSNGEIRVTSRERGRTLISCDGSGDDVLFIVCSVMSRSFQGHRTTSGYDMTYISVDASVKDALVKMGLTLRNA